jgi:predicted RNA-binding Zn ribbon-like protein
VSAAFGDLPGGPAGFRQGSGRLCLDFVRTLRRRGAPDAIEELDEPPALRAWVHQFFPSLAPPAVDDARLATALALREAVRQLIDAARGPGGRASCHRDAVELVNQAAARPTPAPSLDPTGRLDLWSADPVTAVLSLIARDALDLVTSPAVLRIRECAGPACGAMFVDTSRPGTRRWCSMGTCGNQAKKAALRGRKSLPGQPMKSPDPGAAPTCFTGVSSPTSVTTS